MHPDKRGMAVKTVALETRNLTKVFGNNIANDNISLTLHTGEVLAIIGENGAGKSTFCKMLTGVYRPDGGAIYVGGRQVSFRSVRESIDAGITMVYQERNLIPMLTGAQNICLSSTAKGGVLLHEKQIMEQAEKIRERLHLHTPLDVPVETLGAGEQQLIEIMRALYSNPGILILDEPTASLGEGEIEPFLAFVKELKKAQVGVIFISHKIEEVYAIADRIAVFTDGKNVMTEDIANISQDACIRAMLRSGNVEPIVVPEKNMAEKEILLETTVGTYDKKHHDIAFTGRRGEVVGFYGQVGSGRTEYAEFLTGMRKSPDCTYTFCGETISKPTPLQMIRKGMILTSELRANAMFRSLSLVDNVCDLFMDHTLTTKLGFVKRAASNKLTTEVLQENHVKYASINQPVSDLSGGNIQKLIIGRSVRVEGIKTLILDEPTTGMDVGAKHEVYLQARQIADERDLLCIFISSELDELLAVCDRICVFAGGSIISEFPRKAFDKQAILETAIRGRRV